MPRIRYLQPLTDADVDVPGLIRRARRTADLSQRELAAAVGVDQSTVARWETGHAVPDVLTFARVLALAELSLQAVDAAGAVVDPMSDDAPHDRQGRRYPAHLDLMETAGPLDEPRVGTPHRRRRDATRVRGGLPPDHPTRASFEEGRRRRREERRAQRLAWLLRVRQHPHPEPPPCSCPVECEELVRCPPGCGCRCEPLLTS